MPYPTKYTRQYDFQSYQVSNPTRPLPGDKVNVDLNAVVTSVDELVEFLKTSIRSDGRLANGSVGLAQLSQSINIGFEPPTVWEPGVAYTTDSTVFYGNVFYQCTTEHTSGVSFDESKWSEIVDFGAEADAAAASATAAAASQTAAASSATASAASATNSADSATAASNSATAASGSATTATEQATAAAASATAAATSETNAAASATAAATSATEAAASAASITFASQAEAEAGAVDDKVMSPLRTAQAIAALAASDPAAADRTALKALDTATQTTAVLREAGREGIFTFKSGDYSTHIALDTNEGVYIKADAIASTAGAWVRLFDFQNYWSKWFGAVADYSTDNTSVINSMIAVADAQNTLAGAAGEQTPTWLHVEGGVKFASKNIQWLKSGGWVFVYLEYWANSDLTPGVIGYGSNERLVLSACSGYPNDATGGWVAENSFAAPLHPAIGVNIQKNADNSVAAHSQGVQRIQPTATYSAKASVAMIKDENNMIFRIAHEHYGTVDEYNGVLFYTSTHKTDLVVTNGGVAAGWEGSAVPVVGDVVRDIVTCARYVVTSLATSVLTTDWLSGTATPGNKLLRERAIFSASISGTLMTVTAMHQGSGNISVGHNLLGMFANSGLAAGTTIIEQHSGAAGGVGVYTISASHNIEETELVVGPYSVNGIQGGGVANTETTNVPLQFGLDGKMYTRDSVLIRSKTTLSNGAGAGAGTLGNAPAAGNPTKWVPINDNGTVRYIPAW